MNIIYCILSVLILFSCASSKNYSLWTKKYCKLKRLEYQEIIDTIQVSKDGGSEVGLKVNGKIIPSSKINLDTIGAYFKEGNKVFISQSTFKTVKVSQDFYEQYNKHRSSLCQIVEGIKSGIINSSEGKQKAENLYLKLVEMFALNVENTASTSVINQYVAENAMQGEFNFYENDSLRETDDIKLQYGGIPAGWSVSILKKNKVRVAPIQVGQIIPFKLAIVDNKLQFYLKAYDMRGDWVVEVNGINWRRNPNATGKFNYDSKGFEIADNRGVTILSIDLVSRNEINVQGYCVVKEMQQIVAFGDNILRQIPVENIINFDQVEREIAKVGIRPLFEYFGKDYLHKRVK